MDPIKKSTGQISYVSFNHRELQKTFIHAAQWIDDNTNLHPQIWSCDIQREDDEWSLCLYYHADDLLRITKGTERKQCPPNQPMVRTDDSGFLDYEVRLYKKMLHYVMEKFDWRPSEARQKLQEFFGERVLLSAESDMH